MRSRTPGSGDQPVVPDAGSLPGAPADAYQSWLAIEPAPALPRLGRALAVGAGTALVLTLLGAVLGLVWAAVAPSVPVVRTAGGVVLTQPQPEEFIAADGWFSLLGLGFGVLATIAGWSILRRYRGPVGMLAVVIGTIGAALLAWQLGRQIGLAEFHRLLENAPVGRTFHKPPDLRAGSVKWFAGIVPVVQGVLLIPAFTAAVTYTLLAGWSRYSSLRPETEPDSVPDAPEPASAPVSSDSPAPPAPAAEPAPPVTDAAEPPRG